MDDGSPRNDELFALRRALWEVAERAQRAIAQFDLYVKVQYEAGRSGAIAGGPRGERDQKSQLQASPSQLLTTGSAKRAALRPGHTREVARALRYIEMHFDRRISLERLSRVAACSWSMLGRAFRREIGQSAHEYLLGIRLARAASAMASGDKIEAVMLGTGFRSKRNFYRLFKHRFGVTPAQFSQTMAPDQPGSTSTRTGSA